MNKTFISQSTIAINAPPSKVWDALIKPELIKQYLFGTEVTTDWQVGSPISYKGEWEGKAYDDKGKVLQIEKKNSLSPLSGVLYQPWPTFLKTTRPYDTNYQWTTKEQG